MLNIFYRKLIIRTTFIIVWFAFWIYCYLYYSKSDLLTAPNADTFFFKLVMVVILVLPFMVTKYFELIFSKAFDGVVIDKKLRSVPKVKGRRAVQMVDVADVYVKRDDGDIKIKTFKGDFVINMDYYEIGDHVRYHKGTNYFEKLNNNSGKVICLECGYINDSKKEKCYHCRNKLYSSGR